MTLAGIGAPSSVAGDIDADGRGDVLIGYPDTNQAAPANVVLSPEGSRSLDVRNLPGQRGAALYVGPSSGRSGAALAAIEDDGARG